jgi:hypothetical protein
MGSWVTVNVAALAGLVTATTRACVVLSNDIQYVPCRMTFVVRYTADTRNVEGPVYSKFQ